MGVTGVAHVECPACGRAQDVTLVQSINARNEIEAKRALLAGELNALACACGRTTPLFTTMLFVDPDADLYVRVCPDGEAQIAEGRVTERWIFANGDLVGEEERLNATGRLPRVRPIPPQIPARDRDAVIVLDADQQRAVDLPADTSLVLDGEAGVGKTLVALYRVAALARRARERDRRFRALVLVPTEGRRRSLGCSCFLCVLSGQRE